MAEKEQKATNGHTITRRDEEISTHSDSLEELKKKKSIKIAIYIAIFIVFQFIVIAVFGAVIMRAKSPNIRLSKDFKFQRLDVVSTSSQASFDVRLATQVRVKNPNWGPFKFENSTVTFSHNGIVVGQFFVPRGKVGLKLTKKVNVLVNLDSRRLTDIASLGAELTGGTLTLTSSARVIGKVELIMIMKKNKVVTMNCTIVIDVGAKKLKSLECNN